MHSIAYHVSQGQHPDDAGRPTSGHWSYTLMRTGAVKFDAPNAISANIARLA